MSSTEHNPTDSSRSPSRGRDFTSSGRGGAGNIHPTSTSRSTSRPPGGTGPDDFSQTRGRDVARAPHLTSDTHPGTGIFSSGRGGVGNMRSPSRGPQQPVQTAKEHDVIVAAADRDAELPHSSGRGGIGNIVGRSRSRSATRGEGTGHGAGVTAVHSSGRGGAGNMVHGGEKDEILEERERRAHHHAEGIHSTGRGGTGNITHSPSPAVDHEPAHHLPTGNVSSGRGGAGNIRSASRSRTRED